MKKSFFKVFFSKEKETDWLNSLGQEGYLLTGIYDSKYVFEQAEDQKIYYSIEYLVASPQSEEAKTYIDFRLSQGVNPVVSSGNWVYFVSKKGEVKKNSLIYNKNAKFYFWRSLYLLFFGLCGAILSGYQFFAIDYLKKIGHTGNGQIRNMLDMSQSGPLSGLFNALKTFANFLFELLNKYFKLWTNVLGKSDAVAVLSILLPVTVILLVIAGFNINEYILYKTKAKKSKNFKLTNKPNAEQKAAN